MNRLRYLIAACCLLLTLSSCQHRKDARTEDPADLARAIVDEVRGSVLPFWTDYAPAPDGGFYGTLQRDGTPETEERIKAETKATIRCIPLEGDKTPGTCMVTGRPSKQRVIFARSY